MYEHYEKSDKVFVDREEYIGWMTMALKRCKDKAVVLHLRGIGGIGKSSLLDYWTSTLDTTIRLDCQQYQDFYSRLNVLAKGATLLGIRLKRFDVLWQIRQRFVEGVEPVKEAGREWAKEIAMAIPFIGSLASIGSAISAVGAKVAPKLKGKYGTLGQWLETRLGKNHVTRLLEIIWKEPRHAEFLFLDALLEDFNHRKNLDTPVLFLFDHFEYVDCELAHWRYKARKIAETELWYVFLSSLSNCVGVTASRLSAQKQPGITIEESELLELDKKSCLELLELQGIKDTEFQERIASVSGGNPFIIGSVCDMAEDGNISIEDIEDVRSETLEEVRLKTWRKVFTEVQGMESLVDRAGLLHFFNRRILTILVPELKTDQWNRLIRLSFVRNLGEDKWVFHDLARELVAAELGDRIRGLADELIRLLEEKSREESDCTLLGLARSVQALVSEEEALQAIYFQFDDYDKAASADVLPFLDSIRIDSVKGKAFINRLRGFVLLGLGRVADGEHAFLEAIELVRSTVVDEHDMDQAYIAGSLDGLARLYFWTGRMSEAEEKLKESLRISRNLLKSHPNPQWPGIPVQLMYSLSSTYYGHLLLRLGRFNEAMDFQREAERSTLEYFERSDSEFNDRYNKMIPYAHHNLGVALFWSGEPNEAEDRFRIAVETSKTPGTQLDALYYLGTVLSWTGKLSEAEEVVQQAVELSQRIVVDNPNYAGGLASILLLLGYILRVSHRSVKAEDHYRKALGIWRKIADEQPEMPLNDLALALREFAVFLRESGIYSEAEELSLEALEHTKALANRLPERFAIMLPRILNNHAVLLSKTDRFAEAATILNEAIEKAKQCVQGWPEGPQPVFYIDLESAMLNNLGLVLWSTNRINEAQKALEDAFTLQSQLLDRTPSMFQYHLSGVLNNIGVVTYHSGESSKGEAHFIESLRIRRELEVKTPGRYVLDIASSLNNLAIIEEESNRIKESEKLRNEALDILNQFASKGLQSNKRREDIKADIESKRMSEEYREICNLDA